MKETDLARHFHTKLQQLLFDVIDTSGHAGIDNARAVLLVVTGMLIETVMGSLVLRMTEDEFLSFCADTYRQTVKLAESDDQ
jgi:hypothetical protein